MNLIVISHKENIMALPETHKPDEALKKAVHLQNEKLAENTKYRREVSTYKDHTATSSDTLIEELQKNGQK